MKTCRREFLGAMLAAGATAPLAGFAQQSQPVRRIGFIGYGGLEAEVSRRYRSQLSEALRRFGWEEGRNLIVEWRYAEGRMDRIEGLVQETLHSNVELVMAPQTTTLLAARKASSTTPIVMLGIDDPVENGLVQSIQNTAGNVTGSASATDSVASGMFRVVKEAKPETVTLAFLHGAITPSLRRSLDTYDRQAGALGMSAQGFAAAVPDEVPATLERIAASRPDGMIVFLGNSIIPRIREVGAFVAERKLFAVGAHSLVTNGGAAVLSYSADGSALVEAGIAAVDKILRGAKPADLPVTLPEKYELVINRKVAQAIAYEVPPSLLARASRVID